MNMFFFFFLMIRRPPRSTQSRSSAASDVYKRQILLLDEPSMGLAPLVVQEIFRVLERLRQDNGTTILLVEQNAKAALKLADRGYVLETGKVILEGPADELLENAEVKRAYLGKDK